ncbi:acyl-CoA thioesterase [Phenylobacterium montanum]|uniref:Thioesterase family protein n=1 Tax=Phenylobacterium montanum TaxID=2823693 RepID=A0A975IXB8_9CAUL|nr:thioesterase family protein [Caulobacter sp. S6]QUD89236.1 thioesterase family protein [Caulobacter sp. S6]
MSSFVDATRLIGESGRLTAQLQPDWEIWGPNGGYLSAIALRAAGTVAPAGHRPVSYAGQYLSSPKTAEIEVVVELVKPGRTAACVNVRLVQNGRTSLQAQVWTTGKDAGPEHLDLPRPTVPPPHALPPFEHYMPPDHVPHPFWNHIQGRPVKFLKEGEVDPRGAVSESWYRINDFAPTDDAFLDHARMVLLIDTLPWPTYHRSQVQRPLPFIAPSLDLTVWFHDRPGKADWLFVDSYAPASKAGLIHGGARIWSEDGRLLASGGSQLLVVEGR